MSVVALVLALGGFGLSILFPDRAAGTDPDKFILDGQTVAWIIAALALLGAGSLMLVALVGLYRRHGGLGALLGFKGSLQHRLVNWSVEARRGLRRVFSS